MADQPPTRLAFWIHQVVEYLLGILLLSQAVQSERPAVPVAMGVAVILLAATADGPLAAFHLVPRRWHRVLDVVVIVALAVACVVYRDDLGTVGVVFGAAVVVAMVGLLVRTSYAPRRRASPAPATATSAPDAPLTPVTPSTAPPLATPLKPPTPSKGEAYGRAAGRAVGAGIRSYRRRKSPPPPPP